MSLTTEQVRNGSILYHAMAKRPVEGFTMERYRNACGTPACALGTAVAIEKFAFSPGKNISVICGSACLDGTVAEIFGEGTVGQLFGILLHIHTPQQWCAHYAEWLKGQGHEVMSESEIAQSYEQENVRVAELVDATATIGVSADTTGGTVFERAVDTAAEGYAQTEGSKPSPDTKPAPRPFDTFMRHVLKPVDTEVV